MHPRDRRLYILLGIWVAAFIAVLGAGITALVGNSPHWGFSLSTGGFIGAVVMTFYLSERTPPRPSARVAFGTAVCVCVLSWCFSGTQIWFALRKPTTGYTQAQLDEAVANATKGGKAVAAMPPGFTQQQVDEKIANAVANLNTQLIEAGRQRDAARREADAFRQQIQNAPPRAPTPEEQIPVNWQPDFQLNWYAGPKMAWIRFTGVSTALAAH
jgi:hypothetical protein